jgi:DNA-directed RNA polymerase specialized sigma24 family protein
LSSSRRLYTRSRGARRSSCAGDWHTAEDLAQTALEKVFLSWRKIRRQDAVHAYAHRTLVNSYLTCKHLKHTGELLTGWFPERAMKASAPRPGLWCIRDRLHPDSLANRSGPQDRR